MAKAKPAPKKTHAYVVGASDYGGPGDPSTRGDTGASGQHLTGKMAFAELSMGTALGHLPMGTKLRITYRKSGEELGKSVVAEKLDIGAGGDAVSGHARRIDLWYQTAKALGFNGTGLVKIERLDGKPIAGPNDEKGAASYGIGNNTVGAGILGTGVGPQTETEGHEASEEVGKAVEGVGGFLGELSLAKIMKLLVALGLGAFALIWLSKQFDLPTPIPV